MLINTSRCDPPADDRLKPNMNLNSKTFLCPVTAYGSVRKYLSRGDLIPPRAKYYLYKSTPVQKKLRDQITHDRDRECVDTVLKMARQKCWSVLERCWNWFQHGLDMGWKWFGNGLANVLNMC